MSEGAIVAAGLEHVATALHRIALVMERRLAIEHPPKKEPKDATVTHVKTSEEEILADQGYEQSGLERWLDIGTRERAFSEDGEHAGVQRHPVRSGTDKTRD